MIGQNDRPNMIDHHGITDVKMLDAKMTAAQMKDDR
jgi:hypothetical protein